MTYTNAEKMIENAPNIGSPDAAKQILGLLKNPEKKSLLLLTFLPHLPYLYIRDTKTPVVIK